MTYPDCMEFEIERARRLVRKDKRQRWVYRDKDGAHISETPIPFRDAVSVYWLPMQRCTAYTWRPAVLAHSAIGAL